MRRPSLTRGPRTGERPCRPVRSEPHAPDLRRAHEKLDKAIDRLYRKEPFDDDHERLKFLLERYGAMVQKNRKILSDKQLKPKPAAKPRAKPKNQKLVPETKPGKKAEPRARGNGPRRPD